MSAVKLTKAECLRKAKRIVKSLAEMPAGDALWILYTSVDYIVMPSKMNAPPGTIRPINVNLRPRRRGFPPKLENDRELRAYIHSLDRYLTMGRLRKELIAKFGADRVPCENTLRTYLKRWAQSATE
jgi:hypothetical protein